MHKHPAKKKTRFYLALLVILCLTLFLFIVPTSTYALENPQRYYDWNTYSSPSSKVLGIQAFAQEKTSTPSASTPDYRNYTHHNYLLGFLANIAPNNPLYLIKKMEEGVSTAFTFDPAAREKLRLEFAGERVSEMENMAKLGKAGELTSLSRDYNNTINNITQDLENLKKQNQEITPLLIKTDLETAKHSLILEEVSLKVPPQAEKGLETALSASEKAVDTVADLAKRPAVPQEMADRLQALKAQGLLSQEEVTKLVGSNSRVTAREELRKYVNAQVLSPSDFKKLDETARYQFPQGYFTTLEIKKFQELKELEKEKPDEGTVKRIQEFSKEYKPGEAVPSDLRRWWGPMVRLEELQNTVRLDLISEDSFQYRPEDKQKYQELVERSKPRAEDLNYINNLARTNPDALNDPAYARMKALADKFGTTDASRESQRVSVQNCSGGYHWAVISFMPGGGYCAPNYTYAPTFTTGTSTASTPCPPGYHRNDPQGACYPDNPYGSGIAGGNLPAAGSCPSGYNWVPGSASPRGGYCAPQYTSSNGGGPYPGPYSAPSYCPSGQIFREGKCEKYDPPPAAGCGEKSWWNGQKCVTQKDCGQGSYQDSNGECKSTAEEFKKYESQCAGRPVPAGGCGAGYWDMSTCSCRSGTGVGSTTGGSGTSCSPPSGGCGSNSYWDYGSCFCRNAGSYSGGNGPNPGNYCQGISCGGGSYLDYSTCSCRYSSSGGSSSTGSSGSVGSSCSPPAGGCGSGWYDYSSCSCKAASSQGCYNVAASSCGSGFYWDSSACTCRSSGTTSGSGSCGSGYYWTGSYCAPSGGGTSGGGTTTQPTMDPATACAQGTGCSWNGSSCNCTAQPQTQTSTSTQSSPPPSTSTTTTTESSPPPSTTTTTTSQPAPQPSPSP